MPISGGEILFRCLVNEKVRSIYGIIGDQWSSFIDVIARKGEEFSLAYIGTRHEAAAAHMAEAYARLTNQPGVCLGTVGPGAVNLVPGVYAAFVNSVPLVVLTAQNQTWRIYPDQGSTQGLDQINLFKPIVKWNAVAWQIERIPWLIQQAFRIATAGCPGPVQLDFPSDILFGTIDKVPPFPTPQRYRQTTPPTTDPTLIGQAAQMLIDAKFPLLHPGSGVLRANATDELVQLAEYLSAPVTTSVAALDAMPGDHPLAFLPGLAPGLSVQTNADVVLLIGGRLGDLDYWGKPPAWKRLEDQKLIQIDVESSMIGLNREVDLALVGDAKSTLRFLLSEVKRRTEPRVPSPQLEQFQTLQHNWINAQIEVAKQDRAPIHPLRLIWEARSFFDRSAISVLDGGNTAIWYFYLNRIYEPYTFLSLLDSDILGVGLPYAIGAKLTHPDRQVYLISGDGAFMFNIQELETAVRENAPIIALVVNDQRFGMIAGVQHLMFEDRFFGVDFSDVRYDKVAQAMGCFGERVKKPTEIRPALKRAVASGKPAVIDVIIDRDANLNPPELSLLGSIWLEGCTPPPIEEDAKKEEKRAAEVAAS